MEPPPKLTPEQEMLLIVFKDRFVRKDLIDKLNAWRFGSGNEPLTEGETLILLSELHEDEDSAE